MLEGAGKKKDEEKILCKNVGRYEQREGKIPSLKLRQTNIEREAEKDEEREREREGERERRRERGREKNREEERKIEIKKKR